MQRGLCKLWQAELCKNWCDHGQLWSVGAAVRCLREKFGEERSEMGETGLLVF